MLQAMEQRMAALGFGWTDVTATQAYTVFDIHPLMADEFVRRGAISGGLTSGTISAFLIQSEKRIITECRFWLKLATGKRSGVFGMTIPRTTPVPRTFVARSEII